MKRVAIVQSNYVPWKGYFDLLAGVDELILLDEVQYTRRDWRNRNRIKTAAGVRWLTVAVQVKGRYHQRIDETLVAERDWAEKHWATLRHAYLRAPHFASFEGPLQEGYERASKLSRLSDVNRLLIELVADVLGIGTPISWSTEYSSRDGRNERLLDLCTATDAAVYVSGPAARSYLDEAAFADAEVDVEWIDYSGYREYPQEHPPFEHSVSVLDLLFNTGPEAPDHLKHVGARS